MGGLAITGRSLPLEEEQTVEPGQEYSHGAGLEVQRVRLEEEDGGDEYRGGDVQYPLNNVVGIHEIPQALQRSKEGGHIRLSAVVKMDGTYL